MFRRVLFYLALGSVGVTVVVAIFAYFELKSSLPQMEGEITFDRLTNRVVVTYDEYAVPEITARTRLDALRVLGFVTAQDRMFQMDLLRRKSGGRLAEVFGMVAVVNDRIQHDLGFDRIAERIAEVLPTDQKAALNAYADGVNHYLLKADSFPPEFTLLGYKPEKWMPKDSILVALNMFQILSWSGPEERMLSIMEQCLPRQVIKFLTPDTDIYSTVLMGGSGSARPIMPIPYIALKRLVEQGANSKVAVRIVPQAAILGSNNWVVSGTKTNAGRAILANDMHLPLSVPNIWYRAGLHYAEVNLSGITLPGLPTMIVGFNNRVAWGYTNLMADVVDLVMLQLNPEEAEEYRTSDGWTKFVTLRYHIPVKGHDSVEHIVKMTRWGPVAPTPLLGRAVAIRWSALDETGVDFGLLHMDQVSSVEQAITVMKHAGSPPMNVVLADDSGHIGWTLTGRFPKREGGDGSVSRHWHDGHNGWSGYLPASELPQLIDPPSGFIVTANNRTLGKSYPHKLGHNFAHSYRAYRISQQLRAMENISEKDLFALQLDTRSEFYDFYRTLAIDLIGRSAMKNQPEWTNISEQLLAWNGRADIDSQGLFILVAFRGALIKRVFEPYLRSCSALDNSFVYRWFEMDTPMRQLLTEKNPQTLPEPTRYADWDAFLFAVLEQAVANLKQDYGLNSLQDFTWGQANRTELAHPLARAFTVLSPLLNMPAAELAGCSYCVRVARKLHGASERLVISPGRPDLGIFQMPGGQSGHPLSPHYSDHQKFWVNGIAMPFVPSGAKKQLNFSPAPKLKTRYIAPY